MSEVSDMLRRNCDSVSVGLVNCVPTQERLSAEQGFVNSCSAIVLSEVPGVKNTDGVQGRGSLVDCTSSGDVTQSYTVFRVPDGLVTNESSVWVLQLVSGGLKSCVIKNPGVDWSMAGLYDLPSDVETSSTVPAEGEIY